MDLNGQWANAVHVRKKKMVEEQETPHKAGGREGAGKKGKMRTRKCRQEKRRVVDKKSALRAANENLQTNGL